MNAYLIATKFAQVLTNCNYDQANNCKDTKDTVLPEVKADPATLASFLQVVFGVIAFVAVVIVVISGIRYIISQGNPETHKQAWQTIMYAAIGLVVALSAEMIVTLVLKKL